MLLLGRLITRNEDETRSLAARLAVALSAGDVLALTGELGSGKTRFVQGLARGMGVPAEIPVTSPTFTLLGIYGQGRLPLYHFDFFRVSCAAELRQIGAEEYLWGDGVSAVEWADRAREAMPEQALWIDFKQTAQTREIEFYSDAGKWKEITGRLVRGG